MISDAVKFQQYIEWLRSLWLLDLHLAPNICYSIFGKLLGFSKIEYYFRSVFLCLFYDETQNQYFPILQFRWPYLKHIDGFN